MKPLKRMELWLTETEEDHRQDDEADIKPAEETQDDGDPESGPTKS